MTCAICHKPLSDPESLARGLGPICAQTHADQPGLFDAQVGHIVEGEFSGDIILRRSDDDRPIVNLAQTVVNHSPTGFEWGYGGSGPADLALNILLRFLPSGAADLLHQEFKRAFLVPMPDEGGTIKRQAILDWISAQSKPDVSLFRGADGRLHGAPGAVL